MSLPTRLWHRSLFLVCFAALLLSQRPVQAADPASELRILLVIDTNMSKRGGNDKVLRPATEKCLEDLRNVIDEVYNSDLKKFKGRMFLDVIQGDDVSPKAIRDACKRMPATSSSSLFFYYCGHGATDEKTGETLPRDQPGGHLPK